MKIFLLPLLALSLVGILSFRFLSELPIGAQLPRAEVKMKDISGKEISLKEATRENGLLVMFSCNTCPVVVKNQQRTKEICKYALENKIGVVLVNSNEALRDEDDSYEAMQSYAKKQGYQWHYGVDSKSELADAFGASRTPENFFFDKTGKLIYHGAIDDNPGEPGNVKRSHLKEAITEAVSGKEISVKTTRSVGCSIKRN